MSESQNFGVGAQVFVDDASATDPSRWPASPSGVVIGLGGSGIQGAWGRSGGTRMWLVEFDEPQTDIDGQGPFSEAQVSEKYLQLAPEVDTTHD